MKRKYRGPTSMEKGAGEMEKPQHEMAVAGKHIAFSGGGQKAKSEPAVQRKPMVDTDIIQRKPGGKNWYQDAMEFSYYMPYEVMSLLHLAKTDKAFIISKKDKPVFEEWRKTLNQQKRVWFGRKSVGTEKERNKASEIHNLLKLFANGIANGRIVKAHVRILKSAIKSTPFQPASDQHPKSVKVCTPLTTAELMEIFLGGDLKKQIENKGKDKDFSTTEFNKKFSGVMEYQKKYIEKNGADMIGKINDAFRIMGIDTVRSMAVYLAHAAGETSSLLGLTEQRSKYTKNYKGYEGRGAFHTTLKKNYIRTISYMESLLSRKDVAATDKVKIKKTLIAIKKDPKQAANPEFTFIFSAAYMHMVGGVKASGEIKDGASFLGLDNASFWVAGQDVTEIAAPTVGNTGKTGFELRAEIKAAVYEKALEVLRRKKCNDDASDYGYDNLDWGDYMPEIKVRPGPVRRTLIRKRK